jgi:hypothetical protein
MTDPAVPLDDDPIPDILDQIGPPPVDEEFLDSDDFPEGEEAPEQTPLPDDSIYEVD